MPKILLTVPETNESVTRPIVLDITRQLFDITGISHGTSIFYPGDLEKTMQPGSSFGHTGDINTLPFSARVSVEVEEIYEMDKIGTTATMRPENLFIFRDDRIETLIKPAYSATDVVLSFKYRAVDKVTATRWRDDIRAKISMMRDVYLHDITYHYLIPPEFLVILKEIHTLRETVDGYGETYDDYFRANATQRASVLTTLAGTRGAWGISEKQMRIVGWFDFEGGPELGSREDEGDTWTISFSYKFKYDKPIACVMFYPLMIHNQLIGQKYRPSEGVYEVENHVRSYSLSALHFNEFEKGKRIQNIQKGIAIPAYDEFIPGNVVTSTIRLFTALTSVDETSNVLMNMCELGDIELHPEIIKFMVTEAPYMSKSYDSIFSLSLYQSVDLLDDNMVKIDSALNVSSVNTLSLRSYYHIRLSIVSNLFLLKKEALDRLRENGVVLGLILEMIDPTLRGKGLLPTIIGSRGNTDNNGNNTRTDNIANGSITINIDGTVNHSPNNSNNDGSYNGGLIPGTMGTVIAGTNIDGSSGNATGISYVPKKELMKIIEEINNVIDNGQVYQQNTVMRLFIQSNPED